MEQIGMRELRHRLREFLARAEAGERFQITVFGRPVAQLSPPSGRRGTLDRLVEDGRVTLPAAGTGRLPTPRPATDGVTATQALLAERNEDRR